MKLERLSNLSHEKRNKIRYRQKTQSLKEYFDEEGYLCYDADENLNYKPKKSGRPIKITKST